MFEDFTTVQLGLAAVLVFFAGVVDALAGGGGLLTLPTYLAIGLPPALVLGTNKCASTIGLTVSTTRYWRNIRFSLKKFLPVILMGLIGSALGARLALSIDPEWIRYLLIAALPPLAYSIYSKHDFGKEDTSRSLGSKTLLSRQMKMSLGIGGYDGFFGPGTGTFLAIGFTRYCRYDLVNATARAKIINFTSNVAALATFLYAGKVHVALGLTMGAASVLGHTCGSQLGLKKGAKAIRPVVLLVCAALFLKLLFDAWSGI